MKHRLPRKLKKRLKELGCYPPVVYWRVSFRTCILNSNATVVLHDGA